MRNTALNLTSSSSHHGQTAKKIVIKNLKGKQATFYFIFTNAINNLFEKKRPSKSKICSKSYGLSWNWL
jgi:hypothetical protein